MHIDASHIDNYYNEMPVGDEWLDIALRMQALGIKSLHSKKERAIAAVNIAPMGTRYRYRTDYYIGDLVSVEGNYNTSAVMRVTEHVEIEDETGEQAYPTLAVPQVLQST
jgi:hypothetical protein